MNLQDFFENIDREQQRVKQLPADFQPPKTSPQISGPYPGRNATRGYLVGEAEDSPQYYALVHKVTNTPLSTHRDLESARDAWRGLDKDQRPFYQVRSTRTPPRDWNMTSEATGDRQFDDMMRQIKKGTRKQATADRRERERQSREQARAAFGPSPADRLSIRSDKGVAETSDYFRRREREEAIISGQKPARKKQPAQTSDYARRREQEKKAEKGVAEEGYGTHPSQRVDPRTGKRYVPPKSPLKQGDVKHKQKQFEQGVAEAGYNPLDDERREQRRMDQERKQFKQDELAAELSGEDQRAQQIMSGTWYVVIDGQVWRRQSEPVTFPGRDAARRAGQTIKNRNPGKIVTITTQLPAAKVNEQDYLEAFRATVAEDITSEDVLSSMKRRLGDYLQDVATAIRKDPDLIDKIPQATDQIGPAVRTLSTDDGHEIRIHGNEDDGFRISVRGRSMESRFASLEEAEIATEMYMSRRREGQAITDDYVQEKSEPNLRKTARTQRMMSQLRAKYPQAESDLEALLYDFRAGQRMDRQDINRLDSELDSDEAEIDRIRQDLDDLMRRRGMTEEEIQEAKKDACYHKVRSRYKVWPSAYASGALVQCRKKGADNWGTKS